MSIERIEQQDTFAIKVIVCIFKSNSSDKNEDSKLLVLEDPETKDVFFPSMFIDEQHTSDECVDIAIDQSIFMDRNKLHKIELLGAMDESNRYPGNHTRYMSLVYKLVVSGSDEYYKPQEGAAWINTQQLCNIVEERRLSEDNEEALSVMMGYDVKNAI